MTDVIVPNNTLTPEALTSPILGSSTAQDTLTFIYKGASTNDLYTAYYDGQKWHGNNPIKSQPGGIAPVSDHNPNVAILNNKLYVAYKNATSTDLCLAIYDGTTWTGGVKISSMPGNITPTSNSAPSIAAYKNMLYMTYVTPDSQEIYTAWFDGTTWHGNTKISDQNGGIKPESSKNPAISAYNGKLYIVYLGKLANRLYTATFDGLKWSGNTLISDQAGDISPWTAYTPGICVFNNKLYIAYTGIFTSHLYTAWFDGKTWYGNTTISDQDGDNINPSSSDNPSIAAFYNSTMTNPLEELFVGYRGSYLTRLYTCYKKAQHWYGNDPISDQPGDINPHSNYRPAMAVMASQPISQANWMTAIPDATLVSEINIPGTHDTAAINTGIGSPYACHNHTVSQQLEYGVRMLDVRIQIAYDKKSKTYSFTTCHGDLGSAAGINTYQSLKSLLDECQTFLKSSTKEVIIFSLKVDDWSNVPSQDPTALANLKTFLSAYSGILTMPADIPTLGSVRGKMLLFNRINTDATLGIPISWGDNTTGSNASTVTGRNYTVYVQDKYIGLNLMNSTTQKLGYFTAAMGQKTFGQVVWNYASAVWYGVFGVYIMKDLLNYFGALDTKPTKFGWSLFDYPFNNYTSDTYGPINIISLIIDSNFSYGAYPNKFKIYN